MSDSCRPSKLDPGFAATYSMPRSFRTCVIRSDPGRVMARAARPAAAHCRHRVRVVPPTAADAPPAGGAAPRWPAPRRRSLGFRRFNIGHKCSSAGGRTRGSAFQETTTVHRALFGLRHFNPPEDRFNSRSIAAPCRQNSQHRWYCPHLYIALPADKDKAAVPCRPDCLSRGMPASDRAQHRIRASAPAHPCN